MRPTVINACVIGEFSEQDAVIISKALKRRHVAKTASLKSFERINLEKLAGCSYVLCSPEMYEQFSSQEKEVLRTFNFWVLYSHEQRDIAREMTEKNIIRVMYADHDLLALTVPF